MGNPITIQLLSGTSPTWDALYKFAKITASGNTAITISGAGTPDGGVLHFKQDATGSRTLTINGTAITVKTEAGSLTRVDWGFDGEEWSYHTNVQGGASGGTTELPAPLSFAATASSSSVIGLTWSAVTNNQGYKIYRNTVNDFASATLINTTAQGATSYSATGLTGATLYYFFIITLGNGSTYTDSTTPATASATTQAAVESVLSSTAGLSDGTAPVFVGPGPSYEAVSARSSGGQVNSSVVTAGTVTKVKFYLHALPAGTVSEFWITVYRPASLGSWDFTRVGSRVIIPLANLVVGVNEYSLPTPFAVQVDDAVGVGYVGTPSSSFLACKAGGTNATNYNNAAPNPDTVTISNVMDYFFPVQLIGQA